LSHARGLRVDDHPVLDRRRARGLQLRDPLDLHQAHAASADRLAELRLVTEDGDLDVAVLRAVDQHHALRRLHLAAVDRALAHAGPGARQPAPTPGSGAPRPGAARRATICASNSPRNFDTSEATGIA